ncbi:protein of unknown function [Cupriavidus taiwanensis]|uniref:Uncharacterized protein n=1 Tax=Cupriavidus taiwanensis TaxID=164546 RepID=A0A375I974_9BURK|nr:protein of unknown function [Cupriavidus taiwanensis]
MQKGDLQASSIFFRARGPPFCHVNDQASLLPQRSKDRALTQRVRFMWVDAIFHEILLEVNIAVRFVAEACA